MAGTSRRGRSRRTINQINMVPFIDVMLVLLIIFMVSAPLITTGVVDLPTVGRARQAAPHKIEVEVASDAAMKIRVDSGDASTVALKDIATRVLDAQAGNAETPVVISGDRSVKYESIVKVMDTLQRAGVQRVGLLVKTAGQ